MIKFSIIVPVKAVSKNIAKELIPALEKQKRRDFELIIVADGKKEGIALSPAPRNDWRRKAGMTKMDSGQARMTDVKVRMIFSPSKAGPADKRDLGADKARGEILVFIDDDAYPAKDWLKNALVNFDKSEVAGVGGPGITPPSDSLRQKVSGHVWSTWLGAGGAGVYRNRLGKKREVDDYPTFNLLVRKKDFGKIGGFDSNFWPGEDTKLCHDLVYKLGKKIVYDPRVLVYHHRREVFGAHLKQISRFAVHRGHFARILPKTSRRLSYFMPGLFVLFLTLSLFLIALLEIFSLCFISIPLYLFYFTLLLLYLFLLIFTGIQIGIKEKEWRIGALLVPAIAATHLLYGILFIKGFVTKRLER